MRQAFRIDKSDPVCRTELMLWRLLCVPRVEAGGPVLPAYGRETSAISLVAWAKRSTGRVAQCLRVRTQVGTR